MLEMWGSSLLPHKSLGTDNLCITDSPRNYYAGYWGYCVGCCTREKQQERTERQVKGRRGAGGSSCHPCAGSHQRWCWGGTRGLPGCCPGQTGHGLLLQQGMSAEKAILPASSWERLETL